MLDINTPTSEYGAGYPPLAAGKVFHMELLSTRITILCDDYAVFDALTLAYDALVVAAHDSAGLSYRVVRNGSKGYVLAVHDGTEVPCENLYDILFNLDKWLTLDVQKRRPDLLFIHAAALEFAGKGCLLVAPSGAGKSTTAWALLHHGFNYLSDEHAVINRNTLQLEPYPRALWLRRAPPEYPLPEVILRTSRSIHVPALALPAGTVARPVPLHTVYFMAYDPQASAPELQSISRAQASARFLSQAMHLQALNASHLQTMVDITTACQPVSLLTADLPATCKLIQGHCNQQVR